MLSDLLTDELTEPHPRINYYNFNKFGINTKLIEIDLLAHKETVINVFDEPIQLTLIDNLISQLYTDIIYLLNNSSLGKIFKHNSGYKLFGVDGFKKQEDLNPLGAICNDDFSLRLKIHTEGNIENTTSISLNVYIPDTHRFSEYITEEDVDWSRVNKIDIWKLIYSVFYCNYLRNTSRLYKFNESNIHISIPLDNAQMQIELLKIMIESKVEKSPYISNVIEIGPGRHIVYISNIIKGIGLLSETFLYSERSKGEEIKYITDMYVSS